MLPARWAPCRSVKTKWTSALGRLRRGVERPKLGREAAVARHAINGDAIKSRLDIPTLAKTLPVEKRGNVRKWAYCVEKLGLTRSAADFP